MSETNRRNTKWIGLLLAAAVALPAALPVLRPAVARAEDAIQAADGYDSREIFFDDRTFLGYSASQDAYFEVGKGLQTGDGTYLNLYLTHSPTLLPDVSTATVSIDDVPVDSLRLSGANAKETNWKIDLSGLALGPGYHKITISARLRTSELICENPKNSDAWMVVRQKSRTLLKLVPLAGETSLERYPSPFVERGGAEVLRAIVVVPDDIGQAEFDAAARLAQYLAAQTPNARLRMPVYAESDVTPELLKQSPAIWIGQAGHWGTLGKQAVQAALGANGEADAGGQGWILESASPWNADRAQLVLTGPDAQLKNAAAILSTESLFRQLKGHKESVPAELSSPEEKQPSVGTPYETTFRELGYGNLTTQNALSGSSQVNYAIPDNVDLSRGVHLNLLYKHSASILYDKSVMTVKVNGTPVGGAKLAKATAEGGRLEIDVEPGVLGTSRNLAVEIGFEFANPAAANEGDLGTGCADTYLGDWAVVDAASSLSFTPTERGEAYLQTLPYPFVSGNRWDRTTIVTSGLGTKELQLILTLIGRIGYVGPDTSDIRLADAGAAGAEASLKDRNLIYIGTADKLPAWLNGFEGSYVETKDHRLLSRSPKVELMDALESDSSFLQLTASPLDPERKLLMLTAASDAGLDRIALALASDEEGAKLTGRFAAVDAEGIAYSFPDTQDPYVAPASDPEKTSRRWKSFGVGAPAFGVLTLLAAAAAFLAFWRQRRKGGGE